MSLFKAFLVIKAISCYVLINLHLPAGQTLSGPDTDTGAMNYQHGFERIIRSQKASECAEAILAVVTTAFRLNLRRTSDLVRMGRQMYAKQKQAKTEISAQASICMQLFCATRKPQTGKTCLGKKRKV